MRFLSRLLSRFEGFIHRSSVRFDRAPGRGEVLSRFIFSRNHFSPGNSRVKPDAFLPSRDPVETSVFRTTGLARGDVQSIGEGVGSASSRSLKAWADVLAGAVYDVGLQVRPDNVPERHAAIVGWPAHKDEQLSLAQQLAEAATLRGPA